MDRACAATGNPGMTIARNMRYRNPVPLETPLRVFARLTRTEARKIFVNGSIHHRRGVLRPPGGRRRHLHRAGPGRRPHPLSRSPRHNVR
nr:hypothetical protein [Streptomyces sp. LUP30]